MCVYSYPDEQGRREITHEQWYVMLLAVGTASSGIAVMYVAVRVAEAWKGRRR